MIQRPYDQQRGTPPIRIVLCGPAVSVMADVLSGGCALRGRATIELRLGPFDHRMARSFWEIDDPRVAFNVDALLGGTPGYRDLLGDPPRSIRELGRWLASGALNPAHSLFHEAEYLLAEELTITDRGLYQSAQPRAT